MQDFERKMKKKEENKSNTTNSIKKKRKTNCNRFVLDWTQEKAERIADEMYKYYQEHPDKYHYVSFFNDNDLPRSYYTATIIKKYPYCSFVYEKVRDICIERILDKGFTNNKSTALAIFMLKNLAQDDFKDKQEVEHSGEFNIDIQFLPKAD